MTNRLDALQDFEAAIKDRELEAARLRIAVCRFLMTEHTSKEAKSLQQQTLKSEIVVGQILESLLDDDKSKRFDGTAAELRRRCEELSLYTQQTSVTLDRDVASRQVIESHAKVDVIKNAAFAFTIPASIVSMVKNGVGEHYLTPYQAAAAGLGVSASFLLRQKIKGAFHKAAQGASRTSRKIKSRCADLHVKERAIDTVRQTAMLVQSLRL